jgi:hypothetical protein
MNNQNIEVANFFWGGDLTPYEEANFLSFLHNGFNVNVWSYQKLTLPKEIVNRDANEIISKEFLMKFNQNFQKSNMSSFSNLFRYELILKEGGWWFDSDCICLKDVSDFSKLANNQKFVLALENPDLVGSSVMYINDKNIAEMLLDETNKRINKNNYKFFWGEIGPYLITDVFKAKNLFEKTIKTEYFYKIKPEEFHILFDPDSTSNVQKLLKDSFVCHTWNEMFRKFDIEKKKLPPKNSYLSDHITNSVYTNSNHYGIFFKLRFNFILKYIFKTLSRIKTLI